MDSIIPSSSDITRSNSGLTTFAHLGLIGMKGCELLTDTINDYIKSWRGDSSDKTYKVNSTCQRFGTGEGKCTINETVRGYDIFIVGDMFNYGVTYKMYGMTVPMSPDEHYQDLKRTIAALGGKARRINVIMPMLYEGRQHRRSGRESLDCALALQELSTLGVCNIITFDAHDPRVQNAIPIRGFDTVQPTYQMIKAMIRTVPDISFTSDKTLIVAPDDGGMSRCMYYSNVLGLDLGMFYKRRDYSVITDGRNPIVSHEFLGNDVEGKDVIIVDDMISSGDSILDIAYQLKSRDAKRIFVFASFGLFCNGLADFDKAYEDGMISKVFTTNLTYQTPALLSREWYKSVDMSKYLALLIDALNYDESISGLLDPSQKIRNIISEHKMMV